MRYQIKFVLCQIKFIRYQMRWAKCRNKCMRSQIKIVSGKTKCVFIEIKHPMDRWIGQGIKAPFERNEAHAMEQQQ